MAEHVLVAIGSVIPPERFPGPCRIRGQVIHVWSGSMATGTQIELTRTVAADGQPGLDDWSDWTTVRNARYLDAQIEGSGAFHSLARGGAIFLEALPHGVQPAADAVASAANVALGSALAGIGCFPFAILGVIFSFKTFARARQSGRRTPGRALFALFLSLFVISAGGFLAVLMTAYERTRDAASRQIEARLNGKRAAAMLDPATACDLVHEQILAGTFGTVDSNPRVVCTGPLLQKGRLAQLQNVDADFVDGRDHLTACFAQTARWFVTGVVGGPSACPGISVPPSQATNDAARDDEEKKIRTLIADTYERADVDDFTNRMRSVRDALRGARRTDHPCTGLDRGPLRPSSVDASILDRDVNAAGVWPFLTSDEVRRALDPGEPLRDRARDVAQIRRRGGPYLVVYDSAERVSPEVLKKRGVLGDDYAYRGGKFDGWIVVADTRTASIVCEGKLAFASSHDVRYKTRGLNSEEERVRESLMDDLEEQFKTEATNAIRRLSDGKLHLGYKLLE